MKNYFFSFLIVPFVVVFLMAPESAHAGFDFSPIVTNLSPSGQGTSASFTITNLDPTKMAAQITIVPREPDIDGKEDYKESEKTEQLFRIFPSQLIVDPKGTRTVRVTYIGPPILKSELAFRVIAEELPVDLDDPKKTYKKAVVKITMSTRYIGSLYVTPKDAKSDLVVEGIKTESTPPNLILTFTNNGNAHQVFKNPTVKVSSSGGKEIELSKDELRPLVSQNVLAGKSRRISVPWPRDLASGPLKVTIDTSKE